MSEAPKKPSPLIGRWRITEMEVWSSDHLDEEEPAFIQFKAGRRGEFHFCYVHGQMDCRIGERDAKPSVEWSWEGNDENDAASGRGWAVLKDNGTLTGMIFIHNGDESSFEANKSEAG